ncbi:TPA: hypothetical protein U2C46_002231 [Streptococcus suis]|nr:hypothetical protein [Streptococcus suis]HEM6206305.1 hypothetical protein [Streptococcus suis]
MKNNKGRRPFFYAKIKEKVFSVVIKNNIPINKSDDCYCLLDMEQATPTVVEQSTLDDVTTSVFSRHIDAFRELAK